jgi:2-(1,2-epoxy-1,2-dihydrophenyl)acetyl-CoA isomerase
MAELISLDRKDGIVTLTLNDPERMNAFSADMRRQLIQRFTELNDDDECRAIVLAAAGPNFSAGGDLKAFNETTVRQCRTRLKRGGALLVREMIAGAKPIVAAVEGYAFGAGLALAAASDYVVAGRGAKFCCAFTKVAFIPDLALMYSLPNRVGYAKAKQLIALADTFDVERALQLGVVDEVVQTGEALMSALRVAERFAAGPPLAFEMVKSVFARGLEAMIQAEIDLQPMAWLSEDHKEGKQAFFEKRKPRFVGR